MNLKTWLSKQEDFFQGVTFLVDNFLDFNDSAYKVLQHFGEPVVDLERFQVTCYLPQHGSGDSKKSARYYKESDFNTDRVHCFKCQKTISGFYLFHSVKKAEGYTIHQIIEEYIKLFNLEIDLPDIDPNQVKSHTSSTETLKSEDFIYNQQYMSFVKERDLNHFRTLLRDITEKNGKDNK